MFFGPFHVQEYPAFGGASLSLHFKTDGSPFDHFAQPAEGGEDTVAFTLTEKVMTLYIEANPWSGDRPRPFACDFIPAPTPKEGAPPSRAAPAGTIVLALARDARLDDTEYWREHDPGNAAVARYPGLSLFILRVEDPEVLPDLGDPISIDALLPPSVWNLHAESMADLALMTEESLDTRGAQKALEVLPFEQRDESVTVLRFPDAVRFFARSGRWTVDVSLPTREPNAVAWEILGPVQTGGPQIHVRIVATENVHIQYKAFHRTRDPRKGRVEPVIVEVVKLPPEATHIFPRVGAALPYAQWEPLPPEDVFENAHDQLSHEIDIGIKKMLFTAPQLVVLPVFLASPAAPVVVAAGALSFALGLAGHFNTMNERQFVHRHGIDFFGQRMSPREADEAVALSGAFLAIDALFVVAPAVARTPQVLRWLKQTGPALARSVAEAAPLALRATLRTVRPAVLSALLATAEPRLATRALTQILRKARRSWPPMLLDMELSSVFTSSYRGFQQPELQREYLAYVRRAMQRRRLTSALGADATVEQLQELQLIQEPLMWAARRPGAKAQQLLAHHLGGDWKEMIEAFRPYVPVDAYELARLKSMQKPVPYDVARSFMNATRKGESVDAAVRAAPRPLRRDLDEAIRKLQSARKQFESDHVLEQRFVKDLGRRFKLPAAELQEYEKALTLLVPKNFRVARRVPGFRGYAHHPKTRRLEVLIAFGREGQYTLQEVRDAHYFTVLTLGGPDNPGLAVLDDVMRKIAARTGQTLDFRIPSPRDFEPDRWKYFLPTKDYGMRTRTYLYHRDLLGMELEGLVTAEYPWPARVFLPAKP